jgi:hypothetical protein
VPTAAAPPAMAMPMYPSAKCQLAPCREKASNVPRFTAVSMRPSRDCACKLAGSRSSRRAVTSSFSDLC